MPAPQPFYFDWQFWASIAAFLALTLSQLPPVRLWLRHRRVEVEVHSRLQVTHKVGNPNVGMYVSLRNTGGRDIRVRSMSVAVTREGVSLGHLPAQNYFESASSQSPSLFVPFSLKVGEIWAHSTSFLRSFDRAHDKLFRESLSAQQADVRHKLDARALEDEKILVKAEKTLVQPFFAMFEEMFNWEPGEYIAELRVVTEPGSASFSKKYRFTIYESESAELRSHVNDYCYGGGLAYNVEGHAGVFVPLAEHVG